MVMTSIISNLPNYSPEILLVLTSVILLWLQQYVLLVVYHLGYIGNNMLNRIFKRWIQPHSRVNDINTMPSGHAEKIYYSFGFIVCVILRSFKLFVKNNTFSTLRIFIWSILSIYLFISLFASGYYIINKYHTFEQVIIGAIIGLCIGLITYIAGKLLYKL